MKKIVLQLVTFVFVLSACEQTIDFTGKESAPVMILNGVLTPDSVFTIDVSETKHITRGGQVPVVENAVVEVFSEGNLLEGLKHQGNGIYKGTMKPEAGKNYKVIISYDKNTVSAETAVPTAVGIDRISSNPVFDKDQTFAYIELGVQLTDPATSTNYYRITVEHLPEAGELQNKPYVYSNDIVMNATYGGNDDGLSNSITNSYLIFNDKLFKGKQYEVKLRFYDYDVLFALQNEGFEIRKAYKVYLHSISREYFLYLKSRELGEYNNDDPFSEPVPIFSNISGGSGIFAASSVAEADLNVEYPEDLFP